MAADIKTNAGLATLSPLFAFSDGYEWLSSSWKGKGERKSTKGGQKIVGEEVTLQKKSKTKKRRRSKKEEEEEEEEKEDKEKWW